MEPGVTSTDVTFNPAVGYVDYYNVTIATNVQPEIVLDTVTVYPPFGN